MSGHLLLDWAVLAVSIWNTMLLLWLGLTVLLNASRRAWGIWVATGNLFAGAAFLVIHSALYAQGWARISLGLTMGWLAGWVLVVALPFAWYLVMLWYAGYWDDAQSPLHHRHRPWLGLAALMALGLLALLAFSNPFPTYAHIVSYETTGAPDLGTIPLLALAYPLYILLCIGLSVDVLLRPAPSGRLMGDLARRRARPWLLATSLALLVVSGLVACIVTWVLVGSRQGATVSPARMALIVGRFDLAIDTVLAGAILLLGQAVVSYEIFTGRVLPRRSLRRRWYTAVVIAAGLSVLFAGTLTHGVRPVSSVLLASALVALAFAVEGRQSFAERERYLEQLRPFLASQRLYEHLRTEPPTAAPDAQAKALFEAMCADLLGARVAYLAALGPLAPLAGPPLSYPPGLPAPAWPPLAGQPGLAGIPCFPVDPAAHGGAPWAVPLWSSGQPIGILLLGDKRDGGLYAEEEIEFARAGSERLLDTLASAELARRLMALQRQRLAESRVLDGHTRRTLHDDVLPRLHAAILSLSSGAPPRHGGAEASDPHTESSPVELLSDVHRRISDLLSDRPVPASPTLARLGLIGALEELVAGELAGSFDDVAWQVEPEAEERARALPLAVAEVLFYAAREALRNAARHGRGNENGRPLRLTIAALMRDGLELRIEDNGVGLQAANGSAGGSGQGLALHSTMMAVVGGSLAVESLEGAYTRVSLLLPAAAWPPQATGIAPGP